MNIRGPSETGRTPWPGERQRFHPHEFSDIRQAEPSLLPRRLELLRQVSKLLEVCGLAGGATPIKVEFCDETRSITLAVSGVDNPIQTSILERWCSEQQSLPTLFARRSAMLDRSQLSLAVGHADVAAHMGFHSSADYFHTGEIDRQWWKDVRTLGRVIKPLTLAERAFVTIDGDVIADVTVADGATVVVYGKVRSSIEMIGQSELVIAGDVLEGASISANGIFHVFVGGNLDGCLRSRGSCAAWVQGHLRGPVWTGHPSTELRVFGDCTATIRPGAKPSLLYLEVGGHMEYALLEATAAVGYTEFNASVGSSDRPPGLYPDETTYASFRQHRSYNRWTIRGPANQPA